MRHGGIGAEEDAFDPTEDSGVGADSESETENREDRKAWAAAKHSQAKAKILQSGLNHGESSLVAVDFLGLLDAAKTAKRFAACVVRRHAFFQVEVNGHFQMGTQFVFEIAFQM